MILVVGGIASGKRSYVRSLGYRDEQVDGSLASGTPVLYGLDELLHTGPLDSEGMEAALAKEVICCCEVGQGVVPIDADDRAWRELVGRTCAALAARATRVVRLICGIPCVLKDDEEGPTL